MPTNNRTASQKKAINKYQTKIDSGTLTKPQFDRLHYDDRYSYLDKELKKKYPTPRLVENDPTRNRYIGGYYDCYNCAVIDLFNLPDYLSETE